MRTKILYVVVCDETHSYIEQAAISAYSVKYYNPTADIILLVDNKTNNLITTSRGLIKSIVSDIIVVPVPKEFDSRMASRYIKTTARKWVEGDYLFIDTDTVICQDLSNIDKFDGDIGAVLDLHVTLDKSGYLAMVEKQAKAMSWSLSEKDFNYFNSGVMFVKDSQVAHALYEKWHQSWKLKAKLGLYTDQPALAYANNQCGFVIKELGGAWNCQLFVNGFPYFNEAKIIHYFSSSVNKRAKISPYYFSSLDLLDVIKREQKFPDDFLTYIESPKCKAFPACKTKIVSGEDYDLFVSDVIEFVYSLYYYYPKRFAVIKCLVDLYYKLKRIIK